MPPPPKAVFPVIVQFNNSGLDRLQNTPPPSLPLIFPVIKQLMIVFEWSKSKHLMPTPVLALPTPPVIVKPSSVDEVMLSIVTT